MLEQISKAEGLDEITEEDEEDEKSFKNEKIDDDRV